MLEEFVNRATIMLIAYFVGISTGHYFFYKLKYFRRRKVERDLGYDKSNLRRQFFWSVLTCVLSGGSIGIMLYFAKQGHTALYIDHSQWPLYYFPLSILLYLIGFDWYFDFIHRILHSKFLFKHVHWVHHLAKSPSVSTLYCMHPVEGFLNQGYFILVLFTVPMHPYALLLSIVIIDLGNWFGHLGHELMPKWYARTFPFLTSATYHYTHHKTGQKNFGYFTNLWDRLYGTMESGYFENYESVTSGNSLPNKKAPSGAVRG